MRSRAMPSTSHYSQLAALYSGRNLELIKTWLYATLADAGHLKCRQTPKKKFLATGSCGVRCNATADARQRAFAPQQVLELL